MADFTVQIIENIKLNGVQRGSQVNKIISGINYTDNRILNTFSGSETTIFSLSDVDGAGTFVTSSLKYARITNIDTTASINLKVSSSTEQLNFKVTPGDSFMLSTSNITGSILSGSDAVFSYGDIASIKVEPVSPPTGSSAAIEYIIATT
jgi:hypothetical protein|tara:strand:+ start:1196 stop:1645 length:450 start_codon:yes stop_codon:yes gene_type:complete